MVSTTDAFIKVVKRVMKFFTSDGNNIENSWNTHIKKLGESDISGIVDDYSDDCMIISFNQTTGIMKKYNGRKGAREMSRFMCELVTDGSDLEGLVSEISEEDKTVFIAWRSLSSGILDYSDSVVYNDEFKIIRQHVIYRTADV